MRNLGHREDLAGSHITDAEVGSGVRAKVTHSGFVIGSGSFSLAVDEVNVGRLLAAY